MGPDPMMMGMDPMMMYDGTNGMMGWAWTQ